jgi:CTP-dependent riboflavin kinase
MSSRERGQDRFEKSRDKMKYYRKNRSELIKGALSNLESPKEPAIAGTVVVAPILATFFVVLWLFEKLDQIPGNTYFDITQYFYVNQLVKLMVLLTLGTIIVTGIGRFVRTRTGFKIEKALDAVIDRIPLLGSVYNITKITVDTVLSGPEGLREPTKMDFEGLRVTAFRTGNQTDDGREVLFLPTSPNITTGFVIEVDPERLEESDETAEEALTRVLSAGFGDSNGGKRKGSDRGVIKGEIFSGMGEASAYIEMEPYQQKFEEITGYGPYPGTLNVRVDPDDVRELKETLEGKKLDNFTYRGEEYSAAEVYNVKIGGEEAAFIDLEITDYGDDVMEIIAPKKLRDELDLEDGDEIEIIY